MSLYLTGGLELFKVPRMLSSPAVYEGDPVFVITRRLKVQSIILHL